MYSETTDENYTENREVKLNVRNQPRTGDCQLTTV